MRFATRLPPNLGSKSTNYELFIQIRFSWKTKNQIALFPSLFLIYSLLSC